MSNEPNDYAPAPPASAAGSRKLLCFVLGLVMAAVIGVCGPYWTVYLRSSRLFADYHTAGATFFLIIVVLVFNVMLGLLWRGFRLKAHELMFVTAMMFASGAIVTSGTIAYFVPAIAAPYYREDAGLTEHFRPRADMPFAREEGGTKLLNPSLYPVDPDGVGTEGIRQFWQGIPDSEPVPWQPWVRPLLMWGVLLMALFGLMAAVMMVMRKQWVDFEHLSFPIARVPLEVCLASAQPRAPDSIFRSRAFWLGVGFSFLGASLFGVIHYVNEASVTYLRVRQKVEITWAGGVINVLPIALDVVVMGLVFLIPNRIAFSVWFLSIITWVFKGFMKTYGWGIQNQHMSYGGDPGLQHMIMGAMIAFVLASVWLSRRHLIAVVRCALGIGDPGYDRDEPSSYRTASLAIVLCTIVATVWLKYSGVSVFYALAFIVAMMVIFYGMARVIAQCGLPTASAPVMPTSYVVSAFGATNMSPQTIAGLHAQIAWQQDVRNLAITGTSHGAYITRKHRGGLFAAMMMAMAVTYLVGTFVSVYLSYRKGGAFTMDHWFYNNSPRLPWMWASQNITDARGPCGEGFVWGAVGAVLMLALVTAQRMLFWWPLHPVGLLMCSTHMVLNFWFPIFLVWLAKLAILKLGGHSAYRSARKFAIGAVLGVFVAGGVWCIIDTITGTIGNPVFYI